MVDLDVSLDEFDRLWRQGAAPRIDEFLAQCPSASEQRGELLRELVAIDMEYRWKHGGSGGVSKIADTAAVSAGDADTSTGGLQYRPTLDDYLLQWPELSHDGRPPAELIVEEYRIRQRWGDRPGADEYLSRFGNDPALREPLEAVQRELLFDEQGRPASRPLSPHLESEAPPDEFGSGERDPRTFGRYRLHAQLGRGGMGEVWLAEDTQLERRVALKIPRMDDVAPQLRDRFVLEAKAAAHLRHAGICPVFDAGEIDGRPFLTMAFIEGETLASRMRRGGGSSASGFVLILSQVARAMQAAHDAGIVHRDLKPSNIMVDSDGNAVVMDFGLAYRAAAVEGSERLTQSGDTLGSPAYMSPEQVEGRLSAIGPATDIYSLGVMLYEGLVGRLPFTGTPSGIMIRIARDEPPTLSALNGDVDRELEQLCLAMLAKDPARRPGSMEEVAERLTAIGQRLEAAAASAATNERPTGRPRRTLLAVVGVAALALMLGAVQYFIQTPFGRVSIEIDPAVADDIQVRVLRDGRVVKVADATSGWSIKLKEGAYQFEPGTADASFTISPRTVRVSRRETELVKVMVSANAPTASKAASSRPGMALEFVNPEARVEVSPFEFDFTQPFTIESWVTPYSDFSTQSDSRVVAYVGDLLLKVYPEFERWEFVAWEYFVNKGVLAAPSERRSAEYGRKTHLAAQWDGDELRLFVNGQPCAGQPIAKGAIGDRKEFIRARLESTNASSQTWSSLVLGRFPFNSAQAPEAGSVFGGTIHGFRLSQKARYDGPFEPGELKPDEATVVLYDFHEGQGDVLHDFSGNGYDGKIIGADWVEAVGPPVPPTPAAPAVPDLALQFDGVDDHVITPVVYDGSHPLTVEAWVAAADPWENGLAISNRGGTGFSLGQYVHAQNPVWQAMVFDRPGPPAIVDLYAQPAIMPRHHLALVWDGATCRLFVNGELKGMPTLPLGAMPASDRPIVLGTHWAGTDINRGRQTLFAGILDEVRISQTARYDQPFSPPSRFEPDEATLALYHCDEAEGLLLQDASGCGNHATIYGAARVPAIRMETPGPYYEQMQRFLAEVARPMPARKGPALEFLRGEARVEVPPTDLDFTEPFTIEGWATPDANYTTFSRGRYLVKMPGLSLKIHTPETLWTLVAWSKERSATVTTVWNQTAHLGHRTHFAFQWNGERLQFFLNGRQCPGREFARGSFDRLSGFLFEQLASARSAPMLLGNHPSVDWEQVGDRSHTFGGMVDAFRLSRGARYLDDFEPETLAPDDATVLLYDFSEGEGDILHDRSGNGYDGKIVGAVWQPAPAELSQLPGLVARPAEIEGVRRWQIDTRRPRAQLDVQRFSPDGNAYAIGSEDGYLRILTGGPRGNLQAICHVASSGHTFGFDWASDSQRFVTASGGTIQTWNVHGEPLARWTADTEAVAWSPDGDWIAGSTRRGFVELRRPDGTPGPRLPLYTHGDHTGISWAPDSRQLVAFSGSTVVIGTAEGEFVRTLPVDAQVRSVEWSPAGDRIAVVTWDGTVEMWEPSGRRVRQNRSHQKGPQSWGWSSDGEFFALAVSDRCALWNRDGAPLWEVKSPQYHSERDGRIAWSSDNEHIFVPKRDRSLLVHRSKDGKVTDTIVEEAPRISGVAWNNRRQLWTASAWTARPLRLFDTGGVPKGAFLRESSRSYDVAWDRAGESVLIADGTNIRRFRVSPNAGFEGDGESLVSGSDYRLVAPHPTDGLIATASYGGWRSVIDEAGRKVVGDQAGTLDDLAFSPDGKWVGGVDGSSVIVWDRESADWRQRVVATDKTYLGIAWASDSRRIATVTNRNTVEVYDLDGQLLHAIEAHPTKNVTGAALAWSPDDRWITWACRSLDYVVQAVELETRRTVTFDCHVAHVADATWIAADQFLTVGEDGLLAAWDVSRGECLWTMVYRHRDERGALQAVTFTPQGAIRHADAGAVEALLYIVEREPGRLEVLSNDRFETEFPAAAKLADD